MGDQTVFAKGFGVANLDTREPVTADTLFRLGSTTKMFTGATLVSLAEAGKVKLNAPIADYIQDLHPKLGRLTSHQLLTHTAGLADETRMTGSHDETALAEGWRNRKDDLCFLEPGALWSYSNPGYWLAGLVIEKASGKLYADAVRELILEPVGMKRSTFRPLNAMTWPMATGHGPEGTSAPTVIRPLADNAGGWPAGQLFSTANEYARFCIAFLNEGQLDGKAVLSPSLIETLSTPYVKVPGGKRQYGYGLSVEEENGVTWLSHTGSRTGYGSMVKLCPAKKFAVIILCNKSGARLPRVANKAIELVLGITPERNLLQTKPIPVTDADLQNYAGVYSNGETSIRLIARDGKLLGPLGAEISKVGEHRFVRAAGFDGEETELVFVPGADGKIAYLCRRGRALKKMISIAN